MPRRTTAVSPINQWIIYLQWTSYDCNQFATVTGLEGRILKCAVMLMRRWDSPFYPSARGSGYLDSVPKAAESGLRTAFKTAMLAARTTIDLDWSRLDALPEHPADY